MSGGQRTLLIVLVLALVGVIAIGALHDDEDATPTESVATATEAKVVSPAELAAFAARSGRPTYWIGPRSGASYELTAKAGGPVYVRYLRDGAQAGDPRPDFVTVATYSGEDGAAELRRTAAADSGAKLSHGPDGALILLDPASPDSAYLVYPDTNVQIELFSPIPEHARRLAARGEVIRVR